LVKLYSFTIVTLSLSLQAAVVTCGGLAPGMNAAIAQLTNTLVGNYGLKQVLGVRYGFRGFLEPSLSMYPLQPDVVKYVSFSCCIRCIFLTLPK